MRKKLISFLSVLILTLSFAASAMAAETDGNASEMNYVRDIADILSYDEWSELEQRAAKISQKFDCGVYVVTVDDYKDCGTGSIDDVKAQIYRNESNGFGIGDDRDGILLLLSMDEGDYALYASGPRAEYVFDEQGRATVKKAFLDNVGDGSWYKGFSGYLDSCSDCLANAGDFKPAGKKPLSRVLTPIGISLLIAFIVCMIQKGKMNSVYKKVEAQAYTTSAIHLTEHYDQYTHTTETRRKIEQKTGNGSSGKA